MAAFHYPWSGSVAQTINPWELWIRSLSSQTGFVNIRNVNTADAALEQEIIETVAGYGRQLGRINDVLMTLIDKPDLKNLTGEERAAVDEFQAMTRAIDAVKREHRSPARLLTELDAVLEGIDELKSHHPELHRTAMSRIRDALGAREIPAPEGTGKSAC